MLESPDKVVQPNLSVGTGKDAYMSTLDDLATPSGSSSTLLRSPARPYRPDVEFRSRPVDELIASALGASG
jgi:hypothetical protein